jgi:DNA repair protein RecN (Recombination protein N)
MLREIRLENLVLVEKAAIPFKPGLNIISGETGAGKSALLHALKLLSGEKGSSDWIKHGESKASVEAVFIAPNLIPYLESIGIEADEVLTIRRELNSSGKSRCFVNDELVNLTTLKTLSSELMDIASQHATTKLLDTHFHRSLVDIYADLVPSVRKLASDFDENERLKRNLREFIETSQKRERETESLKREIEEIDNAKWKEGEEEELFKEYEILSSAQERCEHANNIINLLPSFNKIKSELEHLQKLDPSLSDLTKTGSSSLLELEEIKFELTKYLNSSHESPERHQEIENRLKKLDSLKKRYGASLVEVFAYKQQATAKLEELEQAEEKIEELQLKIKNLESSLLEQSSRIKQEREKAKKHLELAMQKELSFLNLPDSKFEVELMTVPLHRFGTETIAFSFTPNKGGKKIYIAEGASGGELNRLLLALKSILAGKEGIATLVFDEIDANIGGATAVKIGERLKTLGEQIQVITITHFSQVAQFADHHLRVFKQETKGEIQTFIECLTQDSRSSELERMVGRQ